MSILNTEKKENTPRLPLGVRLKLMFSGYNRQILLSSIGKIAPICILAILIIFLLVYVLLHPIDKIKLRYFFSRDFTIEVVSDISSSDSRFNASHEIRSRVLIDGDWIESDGEYYNLVDGELYRCYKDTSGKWQKQEHSGNISSSIGTMLFDKNNYERDKKNPFIWRLKEDAYAETFIMSNIRIERVYGCIAIVGEESRNGYNAEIALCFRGFGTTKIELPWED